jgi:hypothetical protein
LSRSGKLRHLFVKVSGNAPIDSLMRFFIIIVIKERIQPFKEIGSIVSRTKVNVITFNCSPKPLDEYIVRCTASAIHAYGNILVFNLFCPQYTGKLASLVGVNNLGFVIVPYCHFKHIEAIVSVQTVTHPRQQHTGYKHR